MEQLFGDNLVIIYFVVGLSIICYSNFKVEQKIMLMYAITYLCCVLNVLDSKAALIMVTLLIFIYLEYLTEDNYKLKVIKRIRYKIADSIFLMFFQYHYVMFVCAVIMQTYLIRSFTTLGYYNEICLSVSAILIILCIHEVSVQKFEICTISEIMKKIDANPVYEFPYSEIDYRKYFILTALEDKSYFVRENTYNFISMEFLRYRLNRFRDYIRQFRGKERIKRTASAVNHYISATKHIRGYSTIEMQLMRTIGLKNGYNCVLRRKIFEFVYTKIFFTSLKAYFEDNYYSNRKHYKEYLLWIYFRVVKTRINGKSVKPASKAFKIDSMENWSNEGLFIVCMGLSNKGECYYRYSPYYDVILDNELDYDKIKDMYRQFNNKKLK